jgi:dGTPase
MAVIEALHFHSSDEVQHHHENIVGHSENLLKLNRELKNFLYSQMYRHFRIVRMAKRAEHFLNRIFESYIAEPKLFPKEYQAKLTEDSVYRVTADYIASLTDRSALLEYRRLFDPLARP